MPHTHVRVGGESLLAPARMVDRFDRRCACCRDGRWDRSRSPRYRLTLPPGTYTRAPAWASRAHWLTAVLTAAIVHGRDILRAHHIAPDTFTRIMAIHASHADDDTGRGVTIDVEHLRREAGCSERTVQRARAAARELGIATEVFRGRHLTLTERITAYDNGSRQRGLASVYALGCPARLARHLPQPLHPTPGAHPPQNGEVGEHGTPPVGSPSRSSSSRRSVVTSASSADALAALAGPDAEGGAAGATRRAGRRRGPSQDKLRYLERQAVAGPNGGPGRTPNGADGGKQRRRAPSYHPDTRALTEAVRRDVPALHGVPLGRLLPAHHRFATSPTRWTARRLVALAHHVARTRGWNTTPGHIRHPAAWWANLLQGITDTDPTDLPTPNPSPTTAETADSASGQGDTVGAQRARELEDFYWGRSGADTTTSTRVATAWEHIERTNRHDHARAERDNLQHRITAERAEQHLCPHGAGGADRDTGHSPRCAFCRQLPRVGG